MKSISELTSEELRAIADLKEQIDAIITGGVPCCGEIIRPVGIEPKKLRWTQTPDGKRRMSRIQRKAWRNGARHRNMETGGV